MPTVARVTGFPEFAMGQKKDRLVNNPGGLFNTLTW